MNNLDIVRHSCAHLLAAAVLKLFPKAKFGIGPAIKNGFYYDFDLPRPLTPADLSKIEAEMKKLVQEDLKFEKKILSKSQAKKLFQKQSYKLELIDEIAGDRVTTYKTGGFLDLCQGPHIALTSKITPFKLISIAGAYWRGKETNPMLTRIYGLCFESQKELDKYLVQLEEIKKRDHRHLGAALDLFSFHKEAPGMVFFHPKGQIIYQILEDFICQIQKKYDYQEVNCPNMLDVRVWKQSGHWEHYKEAMYFADRGNFALRPMDCPGAILIYKTQTRSYRDLPLRLSEMGTITRKELSGTLHGLFRLQQFTQDDAHLFIREDQIEGEIEKVIKLAKEVYQKFGLSYQVYLSTRPTDFMGELKIWDKAEKALEAALKKSQIQYEISPGEGAFYGPKIDFHLEDAIGRTWQCGTIQLDFQMPEKFDLEYISKTGKPERPVMVHRTILGTIERFMGVLLEHTGGALPFWLSPVQIIILPIADRHLKYAGEIRAQIYNSRFRVEIDSRNETLEKKIREAELRKIPYILIIGDKEIKAGKISLRSREKSDEGQTTSERLLTHLSKIV